ncbi:MAG: cytochrome C oxidase subunit IV family protein [Nevskia sp.]|nr:cytochrome C oxidase subunit IV family protein [Nevskia sp.]
MSPGSEKRLGIAWLILSAITLMSWWIGSNHGHALMRSAPVTFCVIALAAVKVRVVIMEFMEARHAPRLLRRITDAWLALLVVSLLVIYVLSRDGIRAG